MAASTSSEEVAVPPKEFHISTYSDSGRRLSPNRHRCQLCGRFRKYFYCKECIHGGLFAGKARPNEGFKEKLKALRELEERKLALHASCASYTENKEKADVLVIKIKQYRDKNRILKSVVEEKRQRKLLQAGQLAGLRKENAERESALPKYEQKCESLENYVGRRHDEYQANRRACEAKEALVRRYTAARVRELFEYIFPISKVAPPKPEVSGPEDMGESGDSDMVSAIADASRTTYTSTSSWTYPDHPDSSSKYCIVAPTLPCSGNYSAYTAWVAQHRDEPSPNAQLSIAETPSYTIGAALAYTAQLVHVLSYYLNVRLPFKMALADLAGGRMSEQQFGRRVARLNANVLHLCFSQNVELGRLKAHETVHNLLQLLHGSAQLGRQGPIEVEMRLAGALEQPLAHNLHTSDDSDSEEDYIPSEWEAVPHVQSPEMHAGANVQSVLHQHQHQHQQQMMSTQASSMAGGFVNSAAASIASIWRGFTGR